MEKIINDFKLMLDCNKQGMVNQICIDTGSQLKNIQLPISLHSLVAPSSFGELGRLWGGIQEKIMIDDIALAIGRDGKFHHYVFSGYLLKETVLLCGHSALAFTEFVLDELMIINNEQTNKIRLAEKKVGNLFKDDEQKPMNEAFLNDFTALNNELITKKRELIYKNKKIEVLNMELQAVNENMKMFTHSISHDLKEPVRMVNSFLTLFKKNYGESLEPKGKTYIDMAFDGSTRLKNMITDLLEYHESYAISNTEMVDLNKVLVEVKEILQDKIGEKIAVLTNDNLPTVHGSYAGYRQVFQNLIANAIKFTEAGKVPIILIQLNETETVYTLQIKDNGIGVAANQIQQVFHLFKRLNPAEQYEGTGMGLALVKKNIKRMGGSIWLESEEGVGSTFYFTIKKNQEP